MVARTEVEVGIFWNKDELVREKLESLIEEMVEKRIYLNEAVREFEKKFILNALAKTGGNQTKAAQVLGLHRNTLNRKIGQYKLNGRSK
jgi:Fis family transcriptional regulator, factor for inversion stimulation protein